MGIKISESKYIYDKEQIRDGNYRIPASNYENASASMSPTTIASLGFCIAKLNDIIEYDSENYSYRLKQDYSAENTSETTFIGAIYNAAYYNKQLLFVWHDTQTNTFSGLSNLNFYKQPVDNTPYNTFFVSGIAQLPGTYSPSNFYIRVVFDYSEDKNAYVLSTAYNNNIYPVAPPQDAGQKTYGCELADLFDINYNTGEVTLNSVFYAEHFDYLQYCSMTHQPYYISSNSYYGGCIVANVCWYNFTEPASYLLSFVVNFDNNWQGGDQRVVWNHAVCFKIHIETNEQGNHNMELVYDIDLQKVAQSIENEDVFVIEDKIPEEGLTLTDEQDAKIRKAKIVYYKYFEYYYWLSYSAENDTGYMQFQYCGDGHQINSFGCIEYWYKDSSYPKRLYHDYNTDKLVTSNDSAVFLDDLFDTVSQTSTQNISSITYNNLQNAIDNNGIILIYPYRNVSSGNIIAEVYKNESDECCYIRFICPIPNDTTTEQHLITIKVHNTPTNNNYPIELVENINLSKNNSTPVYSIATVTESGTTVLDEDVSSITSADFIQLTNTGAIYRKMLDTSSVIWFAYWNMTDGVITQNIIQYDKSTKELKLLSANKLSSDIVELPDGALAGDTINDDNLNILKQSNGKIISYSNWFFKCSVYVGNIRLDCLTNSGNPNSIPILQSYTYLIQTDTKIITMHFGSIRLYIGEDDIVLDSTGDGTKFLSNDGSYKTINTTEEIPVVTLQVNDTMSTSDTPDYSQPLLYTISQEDAQKLINYPEHVYFANNQSNTNMLLGTLFLKPNTVTQSDSSKLIVYITQDIRISIDITELEHADVTIESILSLPIGDDQHFYDSAGNERRLTNVILLSPNGDLNLNQFSTDSPMPIFLTRSMDTGETYNYVCDSVVMDGMDTIIVFKKIDYAIDQLNVVAIKISVNENNIVTGELISDKTYTLTPKTE